MLSLLDTCLQFCCFAGNDYVNHNRSGNRSYRGNSRHFHNNHENRSNNTYHQDGHGKNSAGSDERTVVATDKSIKVTLNQGNIMKGPVMSVKGIKKPIVICS